MRHHKLIGVFAAVMLLALIVVPVMAQAPTPCAFKGSVTLDGSPCPGSVITIKLGDGTLVPTDADPVTVNADSKYFAIIPQNITTGKPAEGETIYFYVDGNEGGHATWQAGGGATGVKTLDLAASTGAPGTFTLTINVDGQGSTSPSVGTHSYAAYTPVTITAIESVAGWEFDYWSGDASGSNPTTTVTMNANKSVTAHFEEEGAPAATFKSWLYETFVECLMD